MFFFQISDTDFFNFLKISICNQIWFYLYAYFNTIYTYQSDHKHTCFSKLKQLVFVKKKNYFPIFKIY